MVSDSITASIPSAPKDIGKKKRAHRSAKLKQCKLDARREQWLSQGVVKSKGGKEDIVTDPREIPQGCNNNQRENFDSDSPSDSPSSSSSSSVLGGIDSGNNFTAFSPSSSSGGCCSGNITEEEDGGGDREDDCLDDWEAVADALAANENDKQVKQSENSCLGSESSPLHDPTSQVCLNSNSSSDSGSTRENLKQECLRTMPHWLAAPVNSRAWRPDDAFRPQSLPNLSKQRSFPNTDKHFGKGGLAWDCAGAVNVPSSCPICYEDLDFTDTSFLPCLCGFRLCLFCHKRILEEDGRCPGCRKPYEHDPVGAEPNVHGGSMAFKLARSCSMVTRS